MSTTPASPLGRAPVSRRRLLVGGGLGVAVLGLRRLAPAEAANPPAFADGLVDPGEALAPAVRNPYEPGVLPPPPFEPPADGEILFPVVAAEGDSVFVIDNFGDTRGRCCGYYHKGVDIMADEGLPLRAVVDGVVTRIDTVASSGFNGVRVVDETNDVTFKYFHNTDDFNGLVEGDQVRQGDVVGFVGDTGTTAGNFHLHFEYLIGDQPTDPYPLLQRAEHVVFPS